MRCTRRESPPSLFHRILTSRPLSPSLSLPPPLGISSYTYSFLFFSLSLYTSVSFTLVFFSLSIYISLFFFSLSLDMSLFLSPYSCLFCSLALSLAVFLALTFCLPLYLSLPLFSLLIPREGAASISCVISTSYSTMAALWYSSTFHGH